MRKVYYANTPEEVKDSFTRRWEELVTVRLENHRISSVSVAAQGILRKATGSAWITTYLLAHVKCSPKPQWS